MLLNAIESLLDKKLEPVNKQLNKIEMRLDKLEFEMGKFENKLEKLESRFDKVEKIQSDIRETQKTILNFVSEADSEFSRLDEKTKDMEKIKKIININNII